MAAITPTNPTVAGVAPVTPQAVTAADNFFVQPGREYLLIFVGPSSASMTVKIDDPNSAGPEAATQFDPDVTVVVPSGARRMVRVDSRFKLNAFDVIGYSATGTLTGATVEVVGPF